MTRADWPWALAAVAVAVLAWLGTHSPLTSDDLLFMARALERAGEPLSIFDREQWLQHQRPLFYGSFYLLGPLDLTGTWLRLWQVLLWAGTVIGLGAWARARHGWPGALLVACGLLGFGGWLDLLHWRSWLTTTGTTAGLALGLYALWRGRWGGVLLCGLFAAGFKETGPMVLGLAALFAPRVDRRARGVGLLLVALSVWLGSGVTGKLDLASIPSSLRYTLDGLRPLAWVGVLWLHRHRPATPPWALALLALLPLVPGPVPGAITALVALAAAPRWAPVLLVAWGLSLIGETWHATYLVEGVVVMLVALVLSPPLLRHPLPWAVMVATALSSLPPQLARHASFAERARHQAQFLAAFDPEPAEALYFPTGPVYDLDVFVWLQRGATLEQAPTPGTWPVQIGPLSGVWADLAPRGEGMDPRKPPRWTPPGHDRRR